MVRSAVAVEVSRVITVFVGGTLPLRLNGGMGKTSAMRGSRVDMVTIPRPTEQASALSEYYLSNYSFCRVDKALK